MLGGPRVIGPYGPTQGVVSTEGVYVSVLDCLVVRRRDALTFVPFLLLIFDLFLLSFKYSARPWLSWYSLRLPFLLEDVLVCPAV